MTTDNDKLPNSNKRKFVLLGITLFFILAGIAYAIYYTLVLSKEVDTDNAYVGGNLVTLSSQVTGNVQEIRADETQLVKAGAEILKLDPIDANVALTQAEARLGTTVRQLRERYSNVAQYEATIELKKLSLKDAADDLARRQPLAADHTLSGEEVAHAKQAVDNAKASLDVAIKQADASRAAVAGVSLVENPSVLSAKADYVQAWLAARRNAVLAPVTGYVAKRSVQVGSRVTPGTTLMLIVPLDQLWVDANFKESELQNIRLGQAARIEADVYGSKVVYHGKVVGLSAGTGSAFSLLPAQNATGNWIKVVQRVPVRISLDPKELAEHPLRIGLSTLVTLDISHLDGATLGAPMPAAPVYATQTLSQPVQEAESAADAIIKKNLAK
ncbi:HlyD family efflux transporter periplasmic adaptor subunit [Undibacterium sp. RTI2.1]|uniref:HlyD family secretion protein n=1 Tax=unclassified Undibacterium TaxID=2630295 RepID=UPI002AB32FF2|nr:MULTISPECIES: HlyD family efflux transporter periplasmic adaptor subunit [unclassified Undibacterium]MDY7537928.1 HlyD family efflux transporter periplasmic adaptor subunit [Undibacterium sp. 5I1]MEB0031786.1 HlyD family efflux transporter periplasmic adaptor subunit [Undibacterium sp. RTI2.1]MEB0117290.1 HlyD family efflux transporter periplasmic adaptor subunit [Undibacterium sp. RTI2.2]MEB0232614.1 HlyD family efflux transporter periplasmic adaptor subunit [Undibacterium sp. 10I3]MEB0257